MSGATFAMFVITAIILTNLFLGFAAARLMGHGPRKWTDVDNAIMIRFFSPKLLFSRSQRSDNHKNVSSPAKSPNANQHERVADKPASAPRKPVAQRAAASSAGSSELRRVDGKIMLPPKKEGPAVVSLPTEDSLNSHLDNWRQGEAAESAATASIISVTLMDDNPAPGLVKQLCDEVHAQIVRQLRKDRQVLRLTDSDSVWFSEDCDHDEALLPVERIRQQIRAIRFESGGSALDLQVHSAVVLALPAHQASDLLTRLKAAIAFGKEHAASITLVDLGDGPELVDPLDLELGEMTIALDSRAV